LSTELETQLLQNVIFVIQFTLGPTRVGDGNLMHSRAAESLATLSRYFAMHMYPAGVNSADLRPLFALRYQVYCVECRFLPPDAYPDGLESDEFDRRSAHFAAKNAEGFVAGAARLVLPDPEQEFPYQRYCRPFPTFKPPPLSSSAEISRLAVLRDYRRRQGDSLLGVNPEHLILVQDSDEPSRPYQRVNAPLLVLGLYREMYRFSCESGIRYWYASMERGLARVLRLYGFHFTVIGPEEDYYGPVMPYLGDLRRMESHLQRTNPDLLAWFRSGL